MSVQLYHGDCLDILPTLAPGSVDAVVTDPPYGTTACAWDSVIPFEPMWAGVKRVIKSNGAVVLFGSQPFTSALVMSNPQWFKYAWVWEKSQGTNPLNAYYMPLKSHEDIAVFANVKPIYYPQLETGSPYRGFSSVTGSVIGEVYGSAKSKHAENNGTRLPKTILRFSQERNGFHPTQKPIELLRYLIRTYTNQNETVLDFTMGSGTTGVAAVLEGRNFIGIEIDAGYYAIAQRRIADAERTMRGEFKQLSDTATHDDLPLFSEAA